jgi:ParB-like chromosome segregation protein Spo0J
MGDITASRLLTSNFLCKEVWIEIKQIYCTHALRDRVQLQEKCGYNDQILKEMVEHIKRDGISVIPPIIVIKCEHDPMTRPLCECGYEYEMIDGQHRLEALQILGYTKIYARVYYVPQILRWKRLAF